MNDELVGIIWRDDMLEVLIWLFSGWNGIAVGLCILAGCACWDVTRSQHWSTLLGVKFGLICFATVTVAGPAIRIVALG